MGALIVNGESFASKAALKRRVQEILRPGPREIEGNDVAFLLDLFERHPSASEKFGTGIAAIRIVKVPPYNTIGFQIERVDGTRTDISYIECLTPTAPYHWFRASCRSTVVDQVAEAKRAAFAHGARRCPITDDHIDRETAHADHEPPWTFDAIVTAFIAERTIDVSAVAFVDGDNVTESNFADAALADSFAAFHRERARLRMVSRRANLSLLRRRP